MIDAPAPRTIFDTLLAAYGPQALRPARDRVR